MGPNSEIALWALIVSVLGLIVTVASRLIEAIFKNPKEQNQELVARVQALESWSLGQREMVAATFAKHDQVLAHLSEKLGEFAEAMNMFRNELTGIVLEFRNERSGR